MVVTAELLTQPLASSRLRNRGSPLSDPKSWLGAEVAVPLVVVRKNLRWARSCQHRRAGHIVSFSASVVL
jgi:hypothetical protein